VTDLTIHPLLTNHTARHHSPLWELDRRNREFPPSPAKSPRRQSFLRCLDNASSNVVWAQVRGGTSRTHDAGQQFLAVKPARLI